LAPGLLARVILADLWLNRRNALVMLLIVASVVAPVLLLLGLKTGVVGVIPGDPAARSADPGGRDRRRRSFEERLRALAADPRVGLWWRGRGP
jgi:hypothetical protein